MDKMSVKVVDGKLVVDGTFDTDLTAILARVKEEEHEFTLLQFLSGVKCKSRMVSDLEFRMEEWGLGSLMLCELGLKFTFVVSGVQFSLTVEE